MSRNPPAPSRIMVDAVVPFDRNAWCRVAYRDVIDPHDGRSRPELFMEVSAPFSHDSPAHRKVRFPLTRADARGFLKQMRHLHGFIEDRRGDGRGGPCEHGIFPFHRFYFGWLVDDGEIRQTLVSVTTETLGTAELMFGGREALDDLETAMEAVAHERVRPHGPRWHPRLLDVFASGLFPWTNSSPAR